MAVLKIYESQIAPKSPNVAQTGALTIPVGLATQYGQAISSVGKVVEKIQLENKAEEDANEASDLITLANFFNDDYLIVQFLENNTIKPSTTNKDFLEAIVKIHSISNNLYGFSGKQALSLLLFASSCFLSSKAYSPDMIF